MKLPSGLGRDPQRRRRVLQGCVALAVAALVVGGVILASPGVPVANATSALPSASTTLAKPIAAKISKVALPRTAMAVGTLDRWKVAGPEVVAEVGPQVGAAKSGAIALGIDAPVVSKTRTAASVTATVQPGMTYTFTAYARVLSTTSKAVGASFRVGGKTIKLPKLNATWKKVTGSYKAGATDSSATVAVLVSKAVRGLAIDSVTLSAVSGAHKGVNVVPNASFERVAVDRGIVSSSLVTSTKTAAVAVAMPKGKIAWQVLRGSKSVAKGTVTKKGEITALPLKGVGQGFYTLKVTGSDKKTITTTIVVVDSPNPWVYQDKRYGIGLHVDNPIYARAGRDARALGIAEARNDIRWALTEKTKGVYDFSLYKGSFARLQANGIKLLGIVKSGNALYGNDNVPDTTSAVAAYGRYAAAVAARFPLVGLEVYNEFNHEPFNKGCRTAKCYLPLLKAVDAAVAKVKPKLPIVAGATAQYDDAWFRQLWKSGGMKYTDVVSYHPYYITGAPERLTGIAKTARATMKKYGKRTKPVWITELGTSSRTGNRTPVEQASVLLRSSVLAFANGVEKFYWYDLINDGPDKADQESNFGLYSHPVKNVAAVAPKQAGFTQVLTVTQLGGRSFRVSEKVGAGVVSYAFGSKSDSVSVVWAPKGTKTATIKTKKPVVVVNFDGTSKRVTPRNGVVKIKVTKNPVFVRSGSATAGVTK